MKKFSVIILSLILISLNNFAFAYSVRELSDNELDLVSAEGFDINVEAVMELRNMVGINQNNIAAVVATNGNINGANIQNSNNISVNGAGQVGISQDNTACIIALNGSVFNSQINNLNEAALSNIIGPSAVNQNNIGIIIASGAISGNTVNNVSTINLNNISGNLLVNSGSQAVFSFTYNDFSGIITVNSAINNQ